jgi:L-threonylcarbamoyladenylate synthase
MTPAPALVSKAASANFGVTADDIVRAAAVLEAGGLVAFPTETVYGLGADAENSAAVASIYQAKGRPHDHPVIVHLAPGADLAYWSDDIPLQARQLVDAFWPGPLTLILKRAARIPASVSGGQDTVGLRCPSHPVAVALLKAFKNGCGGIAAPSANKFGHVSPTTALHVRNEFGSALTILDGGQSGVGIESTIVDLSRLATHGPVLLRPGHIKAADIAFVIGQMPLPADAAAPRTSGSLASHYAPRTPVALVCSSDLALTLARVQQRGYRVALIHHSTDNVGHVANLSASLLLPAEPAAYAHRLYAALRDMDQAAVDAQLSLILVETPPAADAWLGVNDRLQRAAHGSTGILPGLLDVGGATDLD